MIKQIIDAGHKSGIKVAMCGEMAGDDFFLPVLIGMGIDQLSMPARLIPRVRKVMRSMKAGELGAVAEELLKMSRAEEIKEYLRARIENDWKQAYNLELDKKPEIADKFICNK
jgi:phosphoenolpyruvate-protein phosphotransferase (PTS system enzyme I)